MSDQKVRVLVLDGSIGFGGAIKSLALVLRACGGVEPLVVTAQTPEIVSRWLDGVPVHTLRWRFNYRLRRRLERATAGRPVLRALILQGFALGARLERAVNVLHVVRLARRHRAEVVHLNTGFNNAFGGLLAARLLRLPCVVHMRGMFEPRTRGVRWGMHRVAHVMAVSDAVAETVRRHDVRGERVSTVYDPVDFGAFDGVEAARAETRRSLGAAGGDVLVGIFGRVLPWKGQREFVEAALLAMRADERIRVVVVGDASDGDQGYLDAIRARIEGSGLGHRFVFTGYRDDVERLYAATDVVVHASVMPEPFGMVVPEAMAARRAVIASGAGGPVEVVRHGENGLLVKPRDVEALAAAISALAHDPELRRRLGEEGFRTVTRGLTVAHAATRTEAVYRAVAAAVRPGCREPRPVEPS